jgi:hypothetical protein
MMAGKGLNIPAVAAFPISVLLVLATLLPFFSMSGVRGDYYGIDRDLSGWQFFSSVDLYMLVAVGLAALLAVSATVTRLAGAVVELKESSEGTKRFSMPLYAIPAALLAALAALIFMCILVRIVDVPGREAGFGPTRAFGIFFAALLALLLTAAAAGSIAWPSLQARTMTAGAPFFGAGGSAVPSPSTVASPTPPSTPHSHGATHPSTSPPAEPAAPREPGPRRSPPPNPADRRG